MSPTDRPARRRASTALADTDRDLIQYIVDHADLLDVVTLGRGEGAKRVRYQVGPSVYADDVITPDSTHWLLVPMTTEMLTRLASFGADREDLEPDADREADDCDAEITYPSNVDQSYLARSRNSAAPMTMTSQTAVTSPSSDGKAGCPTGRRRSARWCRNDRRSRGALHRAETP